MERSKSSTKVSEVPGIDVPDGDERVFNDTLKRMLKTPPTPHDKAWKEESKEKPEKKGDDAPTLASGLA